MPDSKHFENVVLLGPQRQTVTVREGLGQLVQGPGPVAAVTAGWEEREPEDLELEEVLQRKVLNLELHRRTDDLFRHDPELFEALRGHRDHLRELQKLYRLRLRHLAPAVEELLRREGPAALLEPEQEAAFEDLRALDAHHLQRITQAHEALSARLQLADRTPLVAHRRELGRLLEGSVALCIAGGHVGVLFNRLWLFAVLDLLPPSFPIVAWSGGAMTLAERVVLFHDSPPQGKGHAEVWGPGLGACPGIVPLPHASKRLHLEDHARVQLISRRFPDAICAALDPGAQLRWDGETWTADSTTMRLAASGELVTAAEVSA